MRDDVPPWGFAVPLAPELTTGLEFGLSLRKLVYSHKHIRPQKSSLKTPIALLLGGSGTLNQQWPHLIIPKKGRIDIPPADGPFVPPSTVDLFCLLFPEKEAKSTIDRGPRWGSQSGPRAICESARFVG